MPRKPNYGFERQERQRRKAEKRQARQQLKAEKTDARKSGDDEPDASEAQEEELES